MQQLKTRTITHTNEEWKLILMGLLGAGQAFYDFYGDVEAYILEHNNKPFDYEYSIKLTGCKEGFAELCDVEKLLYE